MQVIGGVMTQEVARLRAEVARVTNRCAELLTIWHRDKTAALDRLHAEVDGLRRSLALADEAYRVRGDLCDALREDNVRLTSERDAAFAHGVEAMREAGANECCEAATDYALEQANPDHEECIHEVIGRGLCAKCNPALDACRRIRALVVKP